MLKKAGRDKQIYKLIKNNKKRRNEKKNYSKHQPTDNNVDKKKMTRTMNNSKSIPSILY